MIGAALNLAAAAGAVALLVLWIHALVNWDGEKSCDMDCRSCPFPPCEKHEEGESHE